MAEECAVEFSWLLCSSTSLGLNHPRVHLVTAIADNIKGATDICRVVNCWIPWEWCGFSADLAYIFCEAKAELPPGGEDKETVPKFCLFLIELVERSRMTFCRSGVGYPSGNSCVNHEERESKEQMEKCWGKKVQLPVRDNTHSIGILLHRWTA